jgi:hypothetical protein
VWCDDLLSPSSSSETVSLWDYLLISETTGEDMVMSKINCESLSFASSFFLEMGLEKVSDALSFEL